MDPELLKLLATMFGGQQQQQPMDIAALMTAMNQPTPQTRRGMGGGVIDENNPQGHLGGDPFSNGFFGARPGTPEFSGRTTPLDMSAAANAPGLGSQMPMFQAGALAASPQPPMPQQNPGPLMLPPVPQDPDDSTMAQMLLQNQQMAQDPSGFWSQIGGAKAPTKKKKPVAFGASAMPGFSFGAGVR